MQTVGENIYKTARKAAGLTQERAAEMMGISVRSIADYETGQRLPPNDVVEQMVMRYNNQLLAVQHLRNSTSVAQALLPEVQTMALPQAVLTLIDAIYDFADDRADRELVSIARDGVVDEAERPQFERIVNKLQIIIGAALAVGCAVRKER